MTSSMTPVRTRGRSRTPIASASDELTTPTPLSGLAPTADARSSRRMSKISISVPTPLLEFADRWAERHNAESRSAVIVAALKSLRDAELTDEYESAIREWSENGDAELWDKTASDGLQIA